MSTGCGSTCRRGSAQRAATLITPLPPFSCLQDGEDDLEAQEQRELEAALRLSRETFEHASGHGGEGEAHDDDEARQLEEAIRLSQMEHEAQFKEDIPTSQVRAFLSSLPPCIH